MDLNLEIGSVTLVKERDFMDTDSSSHNTKSFQLLTKLEVLYAIRGNTKLH